MKEEKGIEISEQLIEKATKKYLKNLAFYKKGHTIVLMNLSMDKDFRELQKIEPTKINIIIMIAREVAKEMGINPRKNKEKFNKIKVRIRSKIINYIKNDPKLNEIFQKASKKMKFKASERIGRSKLGKKLEKINQKIRQKRMRKV